VTVVHGRRLRSGRGVGMGMGRSRGVGGHSERRLHLIAWLLCGIRIRVRRVGLASELRVTRCSALTVERVAALSVVLGVG